MSDSEAGEDYVVQYLDGHGETSNWISRAGRAKVTYANGDSFEGFFNAKKLKQGQGIYKWTVIGDSEEGEEENGGQATSGTACYKGSYKNGKRNGYGVCNYPSGDCYEGIWQNDKKSGSGTYKYANGDIFSGHWAGDKRNGHGAYVFNKTKAQLVGNWSDGTLVRGKWILPDVASYHGNFSNGGLPIGIGLFTHINGNQQVGEYVQPEDEGEGDERATRKFSGGVIDELNATPEAILYSTTTFSGTEGDYILRRKQHASPAVQRELSQLEQLFISLDANKDGKVNLTEMAEFIKAGNIEMCSDLLKATPQFGSTELHGFLQDLDSNHDGRLDLKELNNYFYLVKLFHICDADDSGNVKFAELSDAMINNPEQFPPGFVDGGNNQVGVSAKLRAGDTNNDRLLSFPEFAHLILALQ